MRLDGRINWPAFEAHVGEVQVAQFAFQDAEATVLGGLHPRDVRVRRSVNLAKLDQQVPQVTLEAGAPRPGEDFANDRRRG
jgi:hypothetical protein